MEDFVIVVLRLLHIVLGAAWFGLGAAAVWIMHPAAERMGDQGLAMLRTFHAYTRFGMIMPIVSVGTTLAGVILWIMRSESLTDLTAFTSTGDLVMVFGAVMGLLAFGHGGAATGRYTGEFGVAAKAYDADPTESNRSILEAIKAKMYLHGNISAWMTFAAIVCMASARYLA